MPMRLSVLFTGNNRDLKKATREGRSELQKFKSTAVNVAATLAGAYGAATTARAIFDTTKEVERLNSQLGVAMGSMEAGTRKFDRLTKFASDIGANVQEVTKAFVQLRNVGLNPSEDAILSYMNTAGSTGKSLEQFVEAVADATMGQFERLNEFGIKAQKEGDKIAIRFRGTTKLVEDNAKAIEQYMTALGQNEFGGYIESQLGGVNDALAKFNNQWIESVRTLEKGGLGETVAGGISVATEALTGLTEFVDENGEQIIDVGNAIAAVFAARIAGSVGNASLAFVAHMAYQQQVTARYAAMNGMAATTATRLRAVGTSARFASRGMALLGGPVGIVALAAFSLYEFSSSAESAEERADRLAFELDQLTAGMDSLTAAQARNQEQKLAEQLGDTIEQAQDLRSEIEQLQTKLKEPYYKSPGGQAEAVQLRKEIDALNGSLSANKDEQKMLEAAIAEVVERMLELKSESTSSSKSIDNLNSSIKSQAEEYAKVTLSLTDQIYKLQEGEAAYERLSMARKLGLSLDSEEMKNLEGLIAIRDKMIQKKEKELELERQRQNMQNSLGSMTQQLMPGVSATNQHADNIGFLKNAKQDTSLMPTMQVGDGQGGFREESEVEKKIRINQMIELEQQRHAEEMARINGDMSAQIDAMWSETFDRFAAGIGDAVATSILEAKSFGDLMQNLAKNVLQTVISGLVEIGVKKLILAGIEQSTAASTAAATTATGVSAAAALTAAYTPAAAMASLATMGGNAAGAIAGMTATMSTAQGLSLMGMAHDGLGRVPAANEGTWMLKRGEMVLNPSQRENFEHVVDAVRSQRAQGGGLGSKGATKVEIIQTNHFEMNGSAGNGDDKEGIEEAMERANERLTQNIYDDFSNGGPLYQRLKASG